MTLSSRFISALTASVLLLAGSPTLAQDAERLAQVNELLADADADKDGTVTRSEMAKHRADQFSKLDRNDDGVVNKKDKPRGPVRKRKFGEALEKIVPMYDTDQDGTMTRAEWNAPDKDIFSKLDRNGDDIIDASEMPPKPNAASR